MTRPSKQNSTRVAGAVETLQLQALAISSELSGRILAPRTAEVRARVAGVVLKRVYREGSDVKQGDVLFLIDPAPFKADFDSARATLAKAEATVSRRACKSSATASWSTTRPSAARTTTTPAPPSCRPMPMWPKPRRPWSAPA
jgi:multidrug efflux pump subunit AcrA (membrane-fusion protein)